MGAGGTRRWRTVGWGLALLLQVGAARGQTLARRGWAGSGMTVERWWEGAVLYEVDPLRFSGGLGGLVERLDYVQELGVDAIVLSPLPLEPSHEAGQPFDPRYGSEEDLARVIGEASRRKMRVLVDLPLDSSSTGEGTSNAARFWLSRGVAGLRLTSGRGPRLAAAQVALQVEELEKICAVYAGGRVLLWDLPWEVGEARRGWAQVVGPEMVVDGRLEGLSGGLTGDRIRAMMRPRVAGFLARATPVPVSDSGELRRSFGRVGAGDHALEEAKVVATLLLGKAGAPLLYFGQEIGMSEAGAMAWESVAGTANVADEDADPGSLLNWYRKLSALRHGSVALRNGSLDVLRGTGAEVVAWVRRAQPGAALISPVVVVCNLSGKAVNLSLTGELRRLGIATRRLRILAEAGAVPGGESVGVGAIAVPAYGVYVGELRGVAGLETMPAPLRRGPGRASSRPSSSGS